MSRQLKWQKKQLAAGRCRACGKPRNGRANYCDDCTVKVRLRMRAQKRKNLGCKPWHPGGLGRPPKSSVHA